LLYLSNGDRAVGKEYYEVFCAGGTARIDDFKTLSLSRNGRTETLKGGGDKGLRRELALTIAAVRHGKDAPIPFEELLEVSETVLAIAEAARTRKELLIN
jgi:predicted dehydrogenase